MTASEFTFLALGLVLGIASGAALVEVLRARPPVPRQVRVFVEADAIPRRRRSTLSHDPFLLAGAETARGGPADRRVAEVPMPDRAVDRRTSVRSGPGIPVFATTAMAVGSASAGGPSMSRVVGPSYPLADPGGTTGPLGALVGIPVAGGDDPVLAALGVSAVTNAMRSQAFDSVTAPMPGPTNEPDIAPSPLRIGTAIAILERPVAETTSGDGAGGSSVGEGGAIADAGSGQGSAIDRVLDSSDSCAAERRIAAERCGLAVRSRAGATEAADAVRLAQRTYDDHMSKADAAAAIADARALRREKEAAQARFRTAYNSAKSAEDAEAAARDWLVEINDVNSTARAAAATAKRERAAATGLGASLERMALEADAARIAAEQAEAACLAARQSLAECDERSAAGITAPIPPAPWVERPGPSNEDDQPLAAALSGGGTPMIFRLVRGDRKALIALVDRLAGEDPVARRRWQLTLSNLVDAIVAVSIEAGALVFPTEHPFWGMFTLVQDREISQALASLGHRFDGLGGFADDRAPTQRDLSLALGYAGLDPMRMRSWPTETEMGELYREVSVAADEHLAQTAGDLSLSELVALLGRRADGLADLWNEWGRVRPLLLDGA